MPADVDRYFKEVKEKNPEYSDAQAWATAWSIFCKHKKPGDPSCHKPTEEYLQGRNKKESDIKVVIARFMNVASEEKTEWTRIKRVVDGIRKDLDKFESAWNKYTSDPGKYKPQLENAVQSVAAIGTSHRVLLRTLNSLTDSKTT